MSPGKTETIISKKDTQQTFNAQPAFATTPKVFAALRVHRREIPHQLVARLIFRVLAQADADGDERRDGPDSNVRSGNHRTITNRKLPTRKEKKPISQMAMLHPMRIVFSFLPTVMMSGGRRLRCYPRWIIIWTEADSAAVRLRDCAD